MTTSGRDGGDLLAHVYDVAVSPGRLEQLIDSWTSQLGNGTDALRFHTLEAPEMLGHVERADHVLTQMVAVDVAARSAAILWVEAARTAAIVVNRAGVIVTANQAAEQALQLVAGTTLSRLPVLADDLTHLLAQIKRDDAPDSSGTPLFRLRTLHEGAPMLVRIYSGIGGDAGKIGLTTNVLSWPDTLSSELMSAFRLTQAETEVLRLIVLGASVKEIAERTQRNESTLRSHVKALLEKTGARSQLELVRITLTLLEPVAPNTRIAPLLGPPGIAPASNTYDTIALSDGRRLDYLSVGDPAGRPFLMLPSDGGFTRLPSPAEQWLAGNRMRMIVPVRAGFGHSSPLPDGRDSIEVAISDMQELTGSLGIQRCPILALCDDFHLAVGAACAAPDRVSAILALGPTMPAHEPKHFKRMPKWTRFIFATARYAPRTLPYVSKAFMQCIRALGPKRFMQTVLAESKADQQVLEDVDTMTAMLRGSEIVVGPRFSAHVAWAAGAIANYAVDWSDKLAACPVPMVVYAGCQDPFAPIETTREFAAITPRSRCTSCPTTASCSIRSGGDF